MPKKKEKPKLFWQCRVYEKVCQENPEYADWMERRTEATKKMVKSTYRSWEETRDASEMLELLNLKLRKDKKLWQDYHK